MNVSTLNFNVGVLGHIDSGKTSIAKALSTLASTACFDQNPQSRERGITLDLGFSSFKIDIPEHLRHEKFDQLQFTLVDCPGHASLIRTIIGGSQIIDLIMLVIDITKGMQTQSAECLIIGEITCRKMIVVLNKIDLIDENKRPSVIEKMKKKFCKTLEKSRFKGCKVVAISARPSAEDSVAEGIPELIEVLGELAYIPERVKTGSLLMAIDHCFQIKGQGTVMTGTILSGSVSVNDQVELPSLKIVKKVKSIQMFHQPMQTASQGDRVGICVTQFDANLVERGLLCTPSSLSTLQAAIVSLNRISHFKGKIASRGKFHISIGHETVLATVQPFKFDSLDFNETSEYQFCDEVEGAGSFAALIEFEHSVICARNSLLIGSKLDTNILFHSNTCRLAFHGTILHAIDDLKYKENFLPKLKIYKFKHREGFIERKSDEYSVICKGLFKKETNFQAFINLAVELSTGEKGTIEGSFGQSGKFKVRIAEGLSEKASDQLAMKSNKTGKNTGENVDSIKVYLNFKRYIYDSSKKMIQ